MSEKFRLVVLISGSGSNLQAIIDACQSGMIDAEIVCVFSDCHEAYGLERAHQAGILTKYQLWQPYKAQGKTRAEYDADLAALVESCQPDLIVLAGWMRLLSMRFLGRFSGKVINLHPALPGTYPGTHAIQRAYEDFQAGNIQHTGVMVHFVPDEGVDDGPPILTQEVPIHPQDALDDLEQRIHSIEHQLIVQAIISIIRQQVKGD